MSSLVLRLVGPLQAWGATEEGENRRVNAFPTRSGVLGMISNAAGLERSDSVSPWESVTVGVRVDKPGKIIRDYHTAHSTFLKAGAAVSSRYYSSDAAFVAVLEGDARIIDRAADAVRNPARPLFLGRKACVPSASVFAAVSDEDSSTILRTYPWLPFDIDLNDKKRPCKESWKFGDTIPLTAYVEAPTATVGSILISDRPVVSDISNRRFATRAVVKEVVNIPNPYRSKPVQARADTPEHTPIPF